MFFDANRKDSLLAVFFMRNILILVGLSGFFLGWNAPNHYPPWTTFHLEIFSGFGTCFVCLAVFKEWVASSGRENISLPPPRVVWIWQIVALVPLIQYFSGYLSFLGDALIGWLYAAGVALSLYAGYLWAAQDGSDKVIRETLINSAQNLHA
jgi:hypothetical protein